MIISITILNNVNVFVECVSLGSLVLVFAVLNIFALLRFEVDQWGSNSELLLQCFIGDNLSLLKIY